jgi:hypothetical protein
MRRRDPIAAKHVLCLALSTVAGCYTGAGGGAANDDAAESADDAADHDADGSGSATDTDGEPVDEACDDAIAPDASVRALNRREYANTIRDLFELDAAVIDDAVAAFPPDAIVGFDNHADSLVASDLLVEQQFHAAETVSAGVDVAMSLPCDPADGESECAAAFVDAIGTRAFRRPLAAGETAALIAVYDDARAAGRDFDTSVRMVIQTLLLSPQFLYRAELGVGDEAGVAEVDAYELASRLSYFLWASMPDDELFAAAADGTLVTSGDVEREARRMLADPRARETLAEFHRQWLELYRLAQSAKDEAIVPGFEDIKPVLLAETLSFVDHVMWDGDGRADTLLVSDEVVVNDALAAYYGLPGAYEAGFAPVPATEERFGLLTLGSLLAQTSNTDRTSPTRRGRFVRDQLLCQPPPPPPDNVPFLPTDVDTDASMRERLAQHVSDPACSGCHLLIDPIGFGLESYDLAGRYRTTENGAAIDASGELAGVDVAAAGFVGARELSGLLVEADEYEACVATQVFEFAMGRSPAAEDECTIESLRAAMLEQGGSIPELLVVIATSKAFRQRTMEVAP